MKAMDERNATLFGLLTTVMFIVFFVMHISLSVA